MITSTTSKLKDMPEKLGRRSFLNKSLAGAINFTLARHHTATGEARKGKPLLIATTDYYDNVYASKFFFDRTHLDQLHEYLASIGVKRHQWMFDTIWDFYNERSSGFDLLSEVVQSAHRHGIELYTIIKPFEGGGFGDTLPNSLPLPEGVPILKDIRGIYPFVRPFVARHPDFSLRRRPGTYQADQPATTIRLVKGDDKPTTINAGNISILTSASNNQFTVYKGPLTLRESVEWRPCFPKSKACRIIHLEGLQLPEGHKYIVIRCDAKGEFTNERGNLVEVLTADQQSVPVTLGMGRVTYAEHDERYFRSDLYRKICPYFRHPKIVAELLDETKGKTHYQDFYNFDERRQITDAYPFLKEGYVAIALGKPEYMLGNLHPIYPEVRKHWLDMITYCLDKGADGINIRHSNHTRSPEAWEYGFNDPVLAKAKGKTDFATIRRVNGDSYTGFLREARELITKKGKKLTIHLYSQMLLPDERSDRMAYIPHNFEWQWETWIRELADDLEFRGAWTFRSWNLRQVLDRFSAVAVEANKPLYFQGNMKELNFDGPHHFTAGEIDMVTNDPLMGGFVLYETAHFTRADKEGKIEGSPLIRTLTKARFF